MNYPAAEQRGILKSIERPKGRGIEPSSAFYQPLAGWRIEIIPYCRLLTDAP
ncbi:MAG TPA: hypothetical protein PLS62_06620 [Desulfobacteraceae bacterium]|nr:hypothetical protein [Desulfobacteraceae bacterium]